MVGPDDKSGCRHRVPFTRHRHTCLGIVSQRQVETVLREYLLWAYSPSPPEEGEPLLSLHRYWPMPKINSIMTLLTLHKPICYMVRSHVEKMRHVRYY